MSGIAPPTILVTGASGFVGACSLSTFRGHWAARGGGARSVATRTAGVSTAGTAAPSRTSSRSLLARRRARARARASAFGRPQLRGVRRLSAPDRGCARLSRQLRCGPVPARGSERGRRIPRLRPGRALRPNTGRTAPLRARTPRPSPTAITPSRRWRRPRSSSISPPSGARRPGCCASRRSTGPTRTRRVSCRGS